MARDQLSGDSLWILGGITTDVCRLELCRPGYVDQELPVTPVNSTL